MGGEHPYYGLIDFSLSRSFRSKEEGVEIISDLSGILDRKYPTTYFLNKEVHNDGPSSLTLLNFMADPKMEKFSSPKFPKDEGDKVIIKTWQNDSTEVNIVYVLNYKGDLDEHEPDKIKFTKQYNLYIGFKSLYLTKLCEIMQKKELDSLKRHSIEVTKAKF
jgi:hypothetical protein